MNGPVDLLDATAPQPTVPPRTAPVDLLDATSGLARNLADPNVPAPAGDFSRAVIQGATLGFGDEINGVIKAPIDAAIDYFHDRPVSNLSDYYDAEVARERQSLSNYADAHPYLSAIGKGLGGLLDLNPAGLVKTGIAGVANAATRAPSIVRAVGQGAGAGAAIGGVEGFGDAEGGLDNRLTGAGTGAAFGAVAGGTLPLAATGLGGLYDIGRNAVQALKPVGASEAAGRILNEAAGGKPLNIQSAPIQGMKPTLGQAANDPGLLWLEHSVQQATPQGADLAAASSTANNQAITGAIRSLGNPAADSSAAMADRLEAANTAARAATKAAWAKAGVNDATGIDVAPLKTSIGDFIGSLTKASRKAVPPDLLSTLDEFGPTESLAEIQDWRSQIGGAAAQAARSGDSNTARILGGLADHVSGFLDNMPMLPTQGGAQRLADYNAARQATADYKNAFNQPAPVRNVLGVDRYGADKVPLSAVADKFIFTGKGAPEALMSYLSAIKGDPEGMQAGRDAFTKKFLDAVQTTNVDQAGAPVVSSAKIGNFLDGYQHVVNSPLFSQSQRDLIKNIGNAADMAARTSRSKPVGSDTFQKLAGDKFIDVLIGPNASKIVPGIGAAVGGFVGAHMEGPIAAMGATGSALFGANELMKRLYAAPRDRAVGLITEAMHDPKLAQSLMTKASPGNAALMAPSIKNRIFGMLGAQAAAPAAEQVQPQWSQ